ncbi:unnamed protein product [Closterium sp. Yama58-4]|nr:unnamed protein product [Closterium sp. Yama58-4]
MHARPVVEERQQLEEMEDELDLEDILLFRTAAAQRAARTEWGNPSATKDYTEDASEEKDGRGDRRKGKAAQQKQKKQQQRRGRGWLNWLSQGMLGAGGSDASAAADVMAAVSDRDLEELYRTLDSPFDAADGDNGLDEPSWMSTSASTSSSASMAMDATSAAPRAMNRSRSSVHTLSFSESSSSLDTSIPEDSTVPPRRVLHEASHRAAHSRAPVSVCRLAFTAQVADGHASLRSSKPQTISLLSSPLRVGPEMLSHYNTTPSPPVPAAPSAFHPPSSYSRRDILSLRLRGLLLNSRVWTTSSSLSLTLSSLEAFDLWSTSGAAKGTLDASASFAGPGTKGMRAGVGMAGGMSSGVKFGDTGGEGRKVSPSSSQEDEAIRILFPHLPHASLHDFLPTSHPSHPSFHSAASSFASPSTVSSPSPAGHGHLLMRSSSAAWGLGRPALGAGLGGPVGGGGKGQMLPRTNSRVGLGVGVGADGRLGMLLGAGAGIGYPGSHAYPHAHAPLAGHGYKHAVAMGGGGERGIGGGEVGGRGYGGESEVHGWRPVAQMQAVAARPMLRVEIEVHSPHTHSHGHEHGHGNGGVGGDEVEGSAPKEMETTISVAVEPVQAVVGVEVLKRVGMFFSHPTTVPTHQEQVIASINSLDSTTARATAKSGLVLATRKVLHLHVDVASLTVVVPHSDTYLSACPCPLLVSLPDYHSATGRKNALASAFQNQHKLHRVSVLFLICLHQFLLEPHLPIRLLCSPRVEVQVLQLASLHISSIPEPPERSLLANALASSGNLRSALSVLDEKGLMGGSDVGFSNQTGPSAPHMLVSRVLSAPSLPACLSFSSLPMPAIPTAGQAGAPMGEAVSGGGLGGGQSSVESPASTALWLGGENLGLTGVSAEATSGEAAAVDGAGAGECVLRVELCLKSRSLTAPSRDSTSLSFHLSSLHLTAFQPTLLALLAFSSSLSTPTPPSPFSPLPGSGGSKRHHSQGREGGSGLMGTHPSADLSLFESPPSSFSSAASSPFNSPPPTTDALLLPAVLAADALGRSAQRSRGRVGVGRQGMERQSARTVFEKVSGDDVTDAAAAAGGVASHHGGAATQQGSLLHPAPTRSPSTHVVLPAPDDSGAGGTELILDGRVTGLVVRLMEEGDEATQGGLHAGAEGTHGMTGRKEGEGKGHVVEVATASLGEALVQADVKHVMGQSLPATWASCGRISGFEVWGPVGDGGRYVPHFPADPSSTTPQSTLQLQQGQQQQQQQQQKQVIVGSVWVPGAQPGTITFAAHGAHTGASGEGVAGAGATLHVDVAVSRLLLVVSQPFTHGLVTHVTRYLPAPSVTALSTHAAAGESGEAASVLPLAQDGRERGQQEQQSQHASFTTATSPSPSPYITHHAHTPLFMPVSSDSPSPSSQHTGKPRAARTAIASPATTRLSPSPLRGGIAVRGAGGVRQLRSGGSGAWAGGEGRASGSSQTSPLGVKGKGKRERGEGASVGGLGSVGGAGSGSGEGDSWSGAQFFSPVGDSPLRWEVVEERGEAQGGGEEWEQGQGRMIVEGAVRVEGCEIAVIPLGHPQSLLQPSTASQIQPRGSNGIKPATMLGQWVGHPCLIIELPLITANLPRHVACWDWSSSGTITWLDGREQQETSGISGGGGNEGGETGRENTVVGVGNTGNSVDEEWEAVEVRVDGFRVSIATGKLLPLREVVSGGGACGAGEENEVVGWVGERVPVVQRVDVLLHVALPQAAGGSSQPRSALQGAAQGGAGVGSEAASGMVVSGGEIAAMGSPHEWLRVMVQVPTVQLLLMVCSAHSPCVIHLPSLRFLPPSQPEHSPVREADLLSGSIAALLALIPPQPPPQQPSPPIALRFHLHHLHLHITRGTTTSLPSSSSSSVHSASPCFLLPSGPLFALISIDHLRCTAELQPSGQFVKATWQSIALWGLLAEAASTSQQHSSAAAASASRQAMPPPAFSQEEMTAAAETAQEAPGEAVAGGLPEEIPAAVLEFLQMAVPLFVMERERFISVTRDPAHTHLSPYLAFSLSSSSTPASPPRAPATAASPSLASTPPPSQAPHPAIQATVQLPSPTLWAFLPAWTLLASLLAAKAPKGGDTGGAEAAGGELARGSNGSGVREGQGIGRRGVMGGGGAEGLTGMMGVRLGEAGGSGGHGDMEGLLCASLGEGASGGAEGEGIGILVGEIIDTGSDGGNTAAAVEAAARVHVKVNAGVKVDGLTLILPSQSTSHGALQHTSPPSAPHTHTRQAAQAQRGAGTAHQCSPGERGSNTEGCSAVVVHVRTVHSLMRASVPAASIRPSKAMISASLHSVDLSCVHHLGLSHSRVGCGDGDGGSGAAAAELFTSDLLHLPPATLNAASLPPSSSPFSLRLSCFLPPPTDAPPPAPATASASASTASNPPSVRLPPPPPASMRLLQLAGLQVRLAAAAAPSGSVAGARVDGPDKSAGGVEEEGCEGSGRVREEGGSATGRNAEESRENDSSALAMTCLKDLVEMERREQENVGENREGSLDTGEHNDERHTLEAPPAESPASGAAASGSLDASPFTPHATLAFATHVSLGRVHARCSPEILHFLARFQSLVAVVAESEEESEPLFHLSLSATAGHAIACLPSGHLHASLATTLALHYLNQDKLSASLHSLSSLTNPQSASASTLPPPLPSSTSSTAITSLALTSSHPLNLNFTPSLLEVTCITLPFEAHRFSNALLCLLLPPSASYALLCLLLPPSASYALLCPTPGPLS